MSNELNDLIEEAKIFDDEIQSTFGKLSAEQLNWKPSENVWSIGQCFDHLITTNEQYFANIQKVADGTHKNNFYSSIPFLIGFIGNLLKKAVSPDSKKKVKNPAVFAPLQSDITAAIIKDFGKNQARFISLMKATKNLDTSKIKVASPIGDVINIRLIDAFEITIMHERRHFNQAKNILETDGFPQ